MTGVQTCALPICITINNTPVPSLSASASAVNCYGGSSTLNATAGFANYAWSGPGGFTASGASATASVAGTYSVIATNNNGCTASASASVSIPSALSVNVAAGVISCYGGTTTVNVTAAGGTSPYTGVGTFTASAGSVDYTVTDANGCSATNSAVISQPAQLILAATDRKSTRLNSSHIPLSRMPSSA